MLKYSVNIWPLQSQREGDVMAIRYAVDLTDTERAAFREIISKNKAKRSTIINAYILLKADKTCGWRNADIALAYEVSTKKVEQLTQNRHPVATTLVKSACNAVIATSLRR